MLTRTHLEMLAAAIVLVLAALGLQTWISEHDLRTQAESKSEAAKQLFDQAQAGIAKLESADHSRELQTAAAISAIQATAAKQTTPAEIAAYVGKSQGLSQPIIVQMPAATPGNPSPLPSAAIPAADLPEMRDYTAKCETCGVSLANAQAEALSRAEQLRLAGEKLSATESDRDAWKQVASGGTIFQRMKRAMRWIAIGGAIGLAATCGSGHCK